MFASAVQLAHLLLLVALFFCTHIGGAVNNPEAVVRRPPYYSVKIDSKRGVLKDLGRIGIQTSDQNETVYELSQTKIPTQTTASSRSLDDLCAEGIPREFRGFSLSDNTIPNGHSKASGSLRGLHTKTDHKTDTQPYGPKKSNSMMDVPSNLSTALKSSRNISDVINQYSETQKDYLTISEEEFKFFNSAVELRDSKEAKSRYLSLSLQPGDVHDILKQNIPRFFDRSIPYTVIDHLHRQVLDCKNSAVFQQFSTPSGLFYSKKFFKREFKVLIAACPDSTNIQLLLHHSYKFAYFRNPTVSTRLKDKAKDILERWLAGTLISRFAYPSKPTTREEDLEDFDLMSPFEAVSELEREVHAKIDQVLDLDN